MKQFFTFLGRRRTPAAAAATAYSNPLRARAARLMLLSCMWLALAAAGAHAQQGELPRVGHAQAPGARSAPAFQTDAPSLPSRRYQINFEPDAFAHILTPLGPDAARELSPNQIGVRRAVVLPEQAAARFAADDGTAVYVLVIKSPGARGLRLHFEQFDLPEGGAVYVYGTEGDYVGGPYTRRGPQSAGEFWSGTVAGETAVVEYHSKGDGLPFVVGELSHLLSDPQADDPAGSPSAALSCELDASCYGDVEKNTVARMVYVRDGGTFVCTGTLMNTTNGSFIPYFMTANHCISTQASASTLETYWFYQTSSCNSGVLRSGIVRLSAGAQLLATSQSADSTLLRLNDNAPAGALFSGWDPNERPLNATVFGLHHPGGNAPPGVDSYLRRADGPIVSKTSSCGASGLTGGYLVDWNNGLTEPGSSGSGIWYTNGGNNYYVGTLSCGPANQDCVTTFSLYGKFSAFYPLVSSYLAPPVTGLQYYPLPAPVRLLDTRAGASACDVPGAPLGAGVARTENARITCTGIPAAAQAIVGNATVVNTTGAPGGFVTLYPSDASLPTVSNLNYVAGQVVPNAFTVKLSSGGAFNIYASSGIHFIVDIAGYYAPPGTGGLYYHPLPTPVRLLDTRAGASACDVPGAPLTAGVARAENARIACTGIPAAAQTIVGNATVVNTTGAPDGFVTLYPSGAALPTASNLNYVAGQVVPNSFTVRLSAGGAFNIYASSGIHFIVDIAGYFSSEQTDVNGTGLLFTPLTTPVRLLDTRAGASACDVPGAPLTAGVARVENARITCTGIPAAGQAIVGNATVVNTTGAPGGFVTLYPNGAALPTVSNLNYVAGQVVPNAFTVRLGSSGAFNIYASSGIHFITDVVGYYAP